MRPLIASLALLSMIGLAACDSSAPQQKAPAATVPAVKAPSAPANSSTGSTATVAVPVAARPLLGTWAPDLANCGGAQTVRISADGYESQDRSCKLVLEPTGDGAFRLNCGGASMALVPVFAPTGEGINVTVGDGKRQTLLRCSR